MIDQPNPGSQEWLDLVVEPIIDPEREIVDPHHHLWPAGGPLPYGVDALVADTGCGHNVVATVFVECSAGYRTDGPEHMRPLGETEFVAAAADEIADRFPDAAPIAGIVAHADLTIGDALGDVLDAHAEAGGGRFRGIRDALSRALEPEALAIPGAAAEGKYADPAFQAGVRLLGERGLTYDTWHYHHQIPEMRALAQAAPETVMVLDHFGTPLGVGQFAGRRDEIFETWKSDISDLAKCENVVAKLGGMAMPDNGFGWHVRETPATSDELVDAQAAYYHHTIESFGPDRCMFESNFPVDRLSLSAHVLWNALKKIAARYSGPEQDMLFSGTAKRVYNI